MDNQQMDNINQQIEEMIMQRFPFTDRERTCWQHKERMKEKRELYRKRLINELKTA